MPVKIWGGDVWSSKKDGTAQVYRVTRNEMNHKVVKFWSPESKKFFEIRKPYFLTRFQTPVKTKENYEKGR